jgi:hypothetical protein
MLLTGVRVLAILSVALYLVPTGAHLFELPGKLALPEAEYMVVQHIYNGWALFGIVGLAAVIFTLLHAIMRRKARRVFVLSLVAFACMLGTQAVFGAFTYPMNVASRNWTVSPEPFEPDRRQWEYSHAASALLTFVALIAISSGVAVDAARPMTPPPRTSI